MYPDDAKADDQMIKLFLSCHILSFDIDTNFVVYISHINFGAIEYSHIQASCPILDKWIQECSILCKNRILFCSKN